jgi:hypothetical protein
MQDQRPLLVVEKNGRTTVVTGWRAVLLALGALLSGIAALVFLGFVFIGIALTIGTVLLIVVPAAILLALITSLFRRNPR